MKDRTTGEDILYNLYVSSSGRAVRTGFMTGSNILCRKMEAGRSKDLLPDYFPVFFAAFFTFAGLVLPKDPLNVFPFFVFLSPRPIIEDLKVKSQKLKVKSNPN